ncbi:MAG: hypothetical protein KC978_13650 [Candidatus Omnitrophica bacterium]|nr:hypothetical protein [Candidatus Omnitrophota bacterium]
MNDSHTSPSYESLRRRILTAGVIILVLGFLVLVFDSRAFFEAYLVAFLFWSGISLGGMIILMIFHLTGGKWGGVLRPYLHASLGTVLLIPLLFLPIPFGLSQLYAWATVSAEAAAHSPHKAIYLTPTFFLIRAMVYIGFWLVLALLLSRRGEAGDHPKISAVGLVIYMLTVSFSSVDWIMSLERHWYSTIYGVVLVSAQGIGAFSLALLLTYRLRIRGEDSTEEIGTKEKADLGNLLLMLVIFWAYITFSQFLIIYYGNLPEEATWYVARTSGVWGWVALALVFFHFILPFILLLSRARKQNPFGMTRVASLLIAMYFLDILWLVVPSFDAQSGWVPILALWVTIGMGGIWTFVLTHRVRIQRPMESLS